VCAFNPLRRTAQFVGFFPADAVEEAVRAHDAAVRRWGGTALNLPHAKSCRYIGVAAQGRRFRAHFYFRGRQASAGTHATAEEAARARDRAMLALGAPLHNLNFPRAAAAAAAAGGAGAAANDGDTAEEKGASHDGGDDGSGSSDAYTGATAAPPPKRYKGVRVMGARFGAQVFYGKRCAWAGTHATAEEAARARDRGMLALGAPSHLLNFPPEAADAAAADASDAAEDGGASHDGDGDGGDGIGSDADADADGDADGPATPAAEVLQHAPAAAADAEAAATDADGRFIGVRATQAGTFRRRRARTSATICWAFTRALPPRRELTTRTRAPPARRRASSTSRLRRPTAMTWRKRRSKRMPWQLPTKSALRMPTR
jgi:hypothetical protein